MENANFYDDIILDDNDYREILKESLKETF